MEKTEEKKGKKELKDVDINQALQEFYEYMFETYNDYMKIEILMDREDGNIDVKIDFNKPE